MNQREINIKFKLIIIILFVSTVVLCTLLLTSCGNKQEAHDIGFVMSEDRISLNVSGLEEGIKVDPFNYLDITYEGKNPSTIVLENISTDNLYSKISFKSDKTENIYSGDKITITASVSSYSNLVLTEVKKTITVEDISTYFISPSDLHPSLEKG